MFDEPEPLPVEFCGEDLKKAPPKPAPAPEASEEPRGAALGGVYRPALALGATVGALLLTSAAAFACRPGRAPRFCGSQPAHVVPRGARRTRRLALYADADYSNDTAAAPDIAESLLHQDPAMDPEDARLVAEALKAAAARAEDLYAEVREPLSAPAAYDAAAPPQKTWAPDEFAEEYSKASRAQVLDVRGEVLRRLAKASAAHDPSADLKDALDLVSGPDYEHAYEKGAPAPVETEDGGFLLGLRDHLLRGAEGLVHQDPAIDLSDLASIKAKARAKLWQKLMDPKFLERE